MHRDNGRKQLKENRREACVVTAGICSIVSSGNSARMPVNPLAAKVSGIEKGAEFGSLA